MASVTWTAALGGNGETWTDTGFLNYGYLADGAQPFAEFGEQIVIMAQTAVDAADAAEAASGLITNPTVETITVSKTDAVTNAVTTVATYGHNSSGTPVAGFGIRHLGKLESSTTADRDAFAWDYTWTTATDASRTSRASLYLVSGGGALAEVLRVDGSGAVTATLTNSNGLPIATGVSGLGAGVATFLATPTSANLAAAMTDESGTGALLFAGGNIGAASATSINFGQTALAYYGEGTATLSNGGNTTYTVQQARYTRIGRICILTFYHLINAIGTGSTSALSGLPFTALAQASGGVADSFNALATNVNALLLTAGGGGTTLSFNSTPAAGTGVSVNPAIWGNGAGVTGAFTFVI